MIDWFTLLSVTHIIGAVLGVGAATFAEIFFLKSLRDGTIDPIEGSFLKVTYRVIRVGLALLIFSGFGFLLLYRLEGATGLLYNPALWAKLTIVIILVMNAVLIQARHIPIRWGSALSLSSWYAALVIGAWSGLSASYGAVLLWYGLLVVVVFATLSVIRKILKINI